MNTPKLVSEIVVVVVLVAALSTTIVNALPKNMSGSPFSFTFEGYTTLEVTEEMDIEVTLPDMIFASNLPEDFKDVTVDAYFGTGDAKTRLGGFAFDTVPANGQVRKSFETDDLPVILFASYLPKISNGDGTVEFPLSLQIKFKYLDWMDTQLLDLGMTMKVKGTTGTGTVTTVVDPVNHNVSTATLNVGSDTGINRVVVNRINSVLGSDIELTCGDASMDIKTTADGLMTVTVEGKYMNAAETLQVMYEKDHKLTFRHGADEITLDDEESNALVKALHSYYQTAEA